MAEPMALAVPKYSGFSTDRAPASRSGRMMEPPPTRMTSTSSPVTFIASSASSASVRMTSIAARANASSSRAAFDLSPRSDMPRRTAMSVAVTVSPPKTRAFSVS
jgi:hypothetical protein